MITDGVTVTGELVNDLDQPVLNGMIRFCIIQPDGSLGSEYIISCEDTNEFVMENMQPNTAYRVIITAPDYAEKVIEKFEVGEEDIDMGKISLGKSLGIESVWSDSNEAPVYYNLQGQRLTSPERGRSLSAAAVHRPPRSFSEGCSKSHSVGLHRGVALRQGALI